MGACPGQYGNIRFFFWLCYMNTSEHSIHKWIQQYHLCSMYSRLCIPYSRKFSPVQIFTEKRPDSSEEIFAVFISRMRDALATPLPVDSYVPYANRRNDTEWRSKEASLCNNGLIFLLRGGLRNYEGIKTATAGEKPGCWIQYTGELKFDNFGASLTDSFVFCIVAGWFFTATI